MTNTGPSWNILDASHAELLVDRLQELVGQRVIVNIVDDLIRNKPDTDGMLPLTWRTDVITSITADETAVFMQLEGETYPHQMLLFEFRGRYVVEKAGDKVVGFQTRTAMPHGERLYAVRLA